MPDFGNLPLHDEQGRLLVVVEAPKGSRMKIKYDPKLHAFVLSRAFQLGVAYPYDWGFIPSTCAEDGDPLDAMVMFDAPTFPGVVIPIVPLGVVRVVQRDARGAELKRNDRIVARPVDDDRWTDVKQLPKRMRDELEQFFLAAVEKTEKRVTIEGWSGPKAALTAIDAAARTHHQRRHGAVAVRRPSASRASSSR
jgi:inorganic pyrophosphatase